MCFEFADLNSLHRFDKERSWERMGERNLCKRHGFALGAQGQCSMGRITGFHRIQCWNSFNNVRDRCDEKMLEKSEKPKNPTAKEGYIQGVP